ncbi:MAG: hypothetical protein IAE94_15270 [Chthoniobacterales bacterium]|nr:hypothetical protein [Chthoniobacterales bacterium]
MKALIASHQMKIIIASSMLFIGLTQMNAEDCCGGQPLPANKECCGDQQYDPNPRDPEQASFNLSAIVNVVKGAVDSTGKCSVNLPGDNLTLSLTKEKVDLCCEEEITTRYKYTGSISADALGATCDFPLVGVPYLAEAGATIEINSGISANVASTPDCEDGEICFSVSCPLSVDGGIYGQVVDSNVLRISGTVGASADAGLEYCLESGLKEDSAYYCVTPNATVSFTFLSFATGSWSWTGSTYCS